MIFTVEGIGFLGQSNEGRVKHIIWNIACSTDHVYQAMEKIYSFVFQRFEHFRDDFAGASSLVEFHELEGSPDFIL